MLLSGKFANEKKRRHIFLEERIAELAASRAEEEERRNQELLYQAKLAKKQETRSWTVSLWWETILIRKISFREKRIILRHN